MSYQGRKALPPAKDGDTTDAFSRKWRRLLCVLDRAGIIRKTRRRFHKRTRREARDELRKNES